MLRLKEILEKKQISQVQLSRAMNTSKVSISCWVTGKAMPSVETLIRLCEILEVGLEDLVDYKAKKN